MISLGENVLFSHAFSDCRKKGQFELFASAIRALPNPVHLQVLVSIEKTGLDKKVIFNSETFLFPKDSVKIMQ